MAILATQRVLTLDYWKLAYDLVPGDVVFDQNGKPVTITLVQTYRSAYCHEVTFNDHLTICGDVRMSLPLEDNRYRQRSDKYKGKLQFKRPLIVKSIEQLLEEPLVNKTNRKKYSVPTAKPLQLPHQTLPVPPFVFGYWFFNRRANGDLIPSVGNRDFVLEKFVDHGYKVKEKDLESTGERNFSTKPTVVSHLVPNIPTKIPNNYLLASAEQRFELLQGILYSKSYTYNHKKKRFRFTDKSKTLISQIQYLAESLGCKTSIEYLERHKHYTVFIKTKMKIFPQQDVNPHTKHYSRRYVTQITKLPDQLCVYIETTSQDKTILVGEGFISCL